MLPNTEMVPNGHPGKWKCAGEETEQTARGNGSRQGMDVLQPAVFWVLTVREQKVTAH